MHTVFVMRFAVPIHSYRDIVRSFIKKNHRVTILFDRKWLGATPPAALESLKKELSQFDYAWAHTRENWWRHLAFSRRQLVSWRRYFFVHQSIFFRERWRALFPRWLRFFVRIPLMELFIKSRIGGRTLARIEAMTPSDIVILRQLEKIRPDIVFIPVANMRYGAVDVDYGRAARALGIPLAGIVFSWDSLTTKGLYEPEPDVMLVWNAVQVEEAVEHHEIPRERIHIVGAPVFDKWFGHGMTPTPRDAFVRMYGLESDAPILLYLGSSGNIAQDETWLLPKLRVTLDTHSDSRIRRTQIMVRPHPGNAAIYENMHIPRCIVLPRGGALPDNPTSLQLFFDCLTHATAVTGLYTSAMIDALIVGRPVIALMREEYRQTQEDAQYFKSVQESGAISEALNFKQLEDILVDLINGDDVARQKREAFVRAFIRPQGIEHSAGEMIVKETEILLSKK